MEPQQRAQALQGAAFPGACEIRLRLLLFMETDGELPYFEKKIFQEELNNINITEDMVNKKLKKVKINKSSSEPL